MAHAARYVLKNWRPVHRWNEGRKALCEHLIGEIYGNPDWPDGARIMTGPIAAWGHHQVLTVTGNRYVLS